MKWKVGDEAYLKGRKNGKGWPMAGVRIIAIPPEPKNERDKYFGVRAVSDVIDWSVKPPHIARRAGEEFNAHYSALVKRDAGQVWPLYLVAVPASVLIVCGEALMELCNWLEQKALEWHFRTAPKG